MPLYKETGLWIRATSHFSPLELLPQQVVYGVKNPTNRQSKASNMMQKGPVILLTAEHNRLLAKARISTNNNLVSVH